MKILITAGGTREYIDGVRYIGNSSSGKTGAELADYLVAQGHEVLWLGAQSAIRPKAHMQQICYETFDDLADTLQNTLANDCFDLVFQAAAVSDFKVTAVELDGHSFAAGRDVKLPTADEVKLILAKQPKLVSAIKSWSKNPKIQVVAFKLTNSPEQQVRKQAVEKLISQEGIDWVAHNDLQEISANSHAFQLYSDMYTMNPCVDILALADEVLDNFFATTGEIA